MATVTVPRRERVYSFRDFVLDTFGEHLRGDPACWILDVAGGKGDLSWLFVNDPPHVTSVIVDPRPTDHSKMARTAEWHWENHARHHDSEERLAGIEGRSV